MRWLIVKTVSIIGFLAYVQGVIVPWAVSSDWLPLWAILILIGLTCIGWAIVTLYLVNMITKFVSDKLKLK